VVTLSLSAPAQTAKPEKIWRRKFFSLMSEYDVVWQFIFIRRAFIRKFLMKCFADIPDDGNDSICEVVRIERLQHQLNFLIPICFPERVENAFVSKNGQLPVPVRDIDQHAIAMFCLLHFQMKKDFLSAIHRVYVFAFTLYVDPDLATGTPLFFPDGINALLLRSLFFGPSKSCTPC
jgi:hypothetical protein